MAKEKTVYVCSNCGQESPKWVGKCPSCGEWNTYVEEVIRKEVVNKRPVSGIETEKPKPIVLSEIEADDEPRIDLHDEELNRVLGGGLVPGSLVLIGGEPGIGKSTLVLQTVLHIPEKRVLYVSGEESARQLKLRADRLSHNSTDCLIVCETSLEQIFVHIKNTRPELVIIDSIQTISTESIESSPGSIAQVRECSASILRFAKETHTPVLLIGHINKEGSIAGPKVLEHMVDCVLYFEGDQSMSYRILRAAKNRFGSTNEIGVFEMEDSGLREVTNPSEMLLSGRPINAPGTCVVGVMEGSRTVLAEVQALVTPSGYSGARRNANGIDYNRAMLLLAVLEKRAGFSLSGCDAYINVVGGLRLDEPATDLAVILAIASSYKDLPVGSDLAAVGEVGLSGEIRSVSHLNQRLSEIARLGFQRCIIPAHVRDDVQKQNGLQTIPVKNIREALKAVFGA